jgi:riboflavin kinase/FMN adenylyltransferase
MQVIEKISDFQTLKKGSVLTIGNFDGVHIGHQRILTTAHKVAQQRKTTLVVLTFEPHPLTALSTRRAPRILTPLVLKEHLLAELGVDCLFVVKSTTELLSLSPADFIEHFVVKGLSPSVVVEGEDFNFGSRRSGNIHTLYNLGAEKGFEVLVVEAQAARLSIGHDIRISSTLIRSLLESGKTADAAIAIGRPYRLLGQIVPGRGKGKKLGFPTANMAPPNQVIPAEGVYAGTAELADTFKHACRASEKLPAVFSIGRSSTLGGDEPLLVEAHLLTADVPDLAGRWLAMDFAEKIRAQIKFQTEAELSAQIAKDCKLAKKILLTAGH